MQARGNVATVHMQAQPHATLGYVGIIVSHIRADTHLMTQSPRVKIVVFFLIMIGVVVVGIDTNLTVQGQDIPPALVQVCPL